ncbi:multidrug resistance-associated protein 1-like [Anthonomus grandis grandis]|uniref:multidrug resistance-associated protein 1-like n=1 Tax=Anthonomus grandis grandis TaxID=2921223 RepID=UPI002165EE66|nr:multidrug resistance-associated protein 1-like [Anthonomus grandis grandis]XP_050313203.1 multidrug resistance-associated protein 1-like [Anthonomus grandis grandis]XP_050313206.1 multidrug resistance-associated protein 1-like [Anthonomus grandis grandis]XP_050313207.1 multidrug resistance-associated protein 1-like [Anthonomus grandis grandis]
MSNETFLDETLFESLDQFCGSPFWNSTLTWHTLDPEFTPCFEKTVLVWIPCLFLWVFSPLEMHYQKASPNKYIPWNWKNSLKLLINALICALCLSDFITNSGNDVLVKVDIYQPLCRLVTFGLAWVLAYRNKVHGVMTSGTLFLFWLLSCICGAPQFRTLVRAARSDTIEDYYEYLSFIIYYPLAIAMLLLNCFGEGIPKIYPYGKLEKKSPEMESSFLNRVTYCFFDPMMYKGWKNPLEMKDMWDLKPEDSASALVPVFESRFAKKVEQNKRKFLAKQGGNARKVSFKSNHGSVTGSDPTLKPKPVSLIPVLWSCVYPTFIMGASLRLINDVVQFANPTFLGLIIGFIGSDEPAWKGALYAVTMFLVACFMTFINSVHFDRLFVVGLRARTVLVSAIYRKALRISNAARKDKTVGEIVNLMSVDAQKFQELVMFVNFLWSAPISIILAISLLYQELGVAVFAGLGTMILLIPLNTVIINRSRRLQVRQMKFKDERTKVMNEVLAGMKVLKLYAWEESFEKQISAIRNKEITTLKKSAYLNAGSQFIWNCAPFMISCATFATYVLIDEKNVLDPSKAFVSLSLLNLLRLPMSMLPNVINQVVQTWVSVGRLNSFLNAEELEPYITHEPSNDPVLIENGTFTWGDEPTLQNINLRVPKNSLTAIVGAVGSGKSSLISATLGEMDKISGKVNTWGSVAYVPQQAWIQNATVQDNILFGKPFDKLKYNKVIEACALKSDFEMLANGDQTEIGEKGINLSGGQKQRISLARAVYADCDIYLLDDPLSAVDSHVGKHIFDHLIGPNGMLKNKTRILVTHAITYLPQTDNIVVLKKGEVTESGSYLQLLETKGAFAEFLQQHITEEVLDEEVLDELQEQLEKTPIAQELIKTISRQRSRISESGSVGSQQGINAIGRTESRESLRSNRSRKPSIALRKRSVAKSVSGKEEPAKNGTPKPGRDRGKLIEAERAEKGNVKMGVYWYYLNAVGLLFLSGTVLWSLSFQGFQIGTNVWLGRWSEDDRMYQNGTLDTGLRDMYLGGYGGLGLGQAVSMLLCAMIFAKGTMEAAAKLHNLMLHNIMRLPMSFFDTTPSGRILSRFSGDVIGIDIRLPMAFNVFINNSFRVLGTIGVICFTTPLFIAVIIPLLALYIFIQRYYVATSRQLRRIESVTRSPIFTHFSETVSGTTVIRAYGQTERFTTVSDERVDKNQKVIYPNNTSGRWLAVRLEMIGNLIILFAALLAVFNTTGLSPALVGLSVSYSMNITNTLNFLVRMISDVETTIVAVERMKEYSEKPQEASWEIASTKPSPEWPEKGQVEFKDYSVRYRPGLDLVLQKINFNVHGGEKVGIVGRTGAGKSSLTLSLFRIIEAAEGQIRIDGKTIGELGLHDLRSKLTIIPQDAVLFSGTLRMNLDPFNLYADQDVWSALELAHLKEFVKDLAAGLNHKVSEGGENLSVGQRQLICLARALLRKTKILILDEATAAVDLETDDLIQKTIRTAFADCTVLTIAHRLNTIIDSDRVLVLDKGQIAEFESPNKLLENKESIFFGMCKDAGLAS